MQKESFNIMKIKVSLTQKVFDIFNNIFMFLLMLVMFYPMWHVVMSSLSDSNMLIGHTGIIIKPLGVS
jgi:putative aldouronate transport system permease protein